MIIKTVQVQPYGTNCYIIGDEASGEGAVIDPGGNVNGIMDAVQGCGLTIKYIILTHCHFDHITAVPHVKSLTGAKVVVHKDDSAGLRDPETNLSGYMDSGDLSIRPDIEAEHNQELKLGGLSLKLIHTPGHTPGGMCILAGNALFSGDTLFSLSVGRTDLPGGDHGALIKSIKERLMALPDGVKVYPGHDRSTDIGRERRNNPYI